MLVVGVGKCYQVSCYVSVVSGVFVVLVSVIVVIVVLLVLVLVSVIRCHVMLTCMRIFLTVQVDIVTLITYYRVFHRNCQILKDYYSDKVSFCLRLVTSKFTDTRLFFGAQALL